MNQSNSVPDSSIIHCICAFCPVYSSSHPPLYPGLGYFSTIFSKPAGLQLLTRWLNVGPQCPLSTCNNAKRCGPMGRSGAQCLWTRPMCNELGFDQYTTRACGACIVGWSCFVVQSTDAPQSGAQKRGDFKGWVGYANKLMCTVVHTVCVWGGGWHKALVVGSVGLWRRLLASRP